MLERHVLRTNLFLLGSLRDRQKRAVHFRQGRSTALVLPPHGDLGVSQRDRPAYRLPPHW